MSNKTAFKPLYIPYIIDYAKQINNEKYNLVLSFICYYLSLGNKEFYFTNEQIKDNTGINERTISRAIQYLKDNKYIKCTYSTSRNGGTYRNISLLVENPLKVKEKQVKTEYMATIDGFLSMQSSEVKRAAKFRIKDKYERTGQYPTLKKLKKRLIDKGHRIIE